MRRGKQEEKKEDLERPEQANAMFTSKDEYNGETINFVMVLL
jgi:hypothetical protein